MSRHYPIFADLHDRPVLLVGAGHVAARKAEDLLRAGARLRVVARELAPVFQDWRDADRTLVGNFLFGFAHLGTFFLGNLFGFLGRLLLAQCGQASLQALNFGLNGLQRVGR